MINYELIKKYSGGNKSISDFKGVTRKQLVRDAWEQTEDLEEAEKFADNVLEALSAYEKDKN